MFRPTYLYIKTHNKTGLKYFGKTTNKDPYKYKGSGTRWIRHIRKHGIDISTEIIGYYTDEQDCKEIALKFSKENNIVESDDWANLKEEGLDGGFEYINENNLNNSKNQNIIGTESFKNKLKSDSHFSENWKQNLSKGLKLSYEEGRRTSIFRDKKFQKKMSERSNTEKVKEKRKQTYKKIEHQKGKKNSQYGTTWIWCKEKGNKKIKKELLQEYIDKGWEKKYIPGYKVEQ